MEEVNKILLKELYKNNNENLAILKSLNQFLGHISKHLNEVTKNYKNIQYNLENFLDLEGEDAFKDNQGVTKLRKSDDSQLQQ